MVTFLITTVFILGYTAIAFEHPLRLNKAASALITGVLCWTIYMIDSQNKELVTEELLHHLGDIASILFFLLGAMTIVELIDRHDGFEFIILRIRPDNKKRLLIIIAFITFFMSAIIDNLTTAIVMTSLITKLLPDKKDKLWFSGIIIIAANAGGAWSPLGDVTTTMLWIGGQITALNIIKQLILPSIAVCILPVLIIANRFKGTAFKSVEPGKSTSHEIISRRIILFSGVGFLLFVPIFKTLTHLPPFMGMMMALGMMWVIITIIHKDKRPDVAEKYNVSKALQRIDTPSILFFLGILLSVSALESFGLLKIVAVFLTTNLHDIYLTGTALGLLSAVVDNVPLVAAAQGMFDMTTYPTDHPFWEFLALTTGTGGSAIIIGSAAGIAVMGIQEVDFIWYLKKISWLAILGFASGIGVFILQHYITG